MIRRGSCERQMLPLLARSQGSVAMLGSWGGGGDGLMLVGLVGRWTSVGHRLSSSWTVICCMRGPTCRTAQPQARAHWASLREWLQWQTDGSRRWCSSTERWKPTPPLLLMEAPRKRHPRAANWDQRPSQSRCYSFSPLPSRYPTFDTA